MADDPRVTALLHVQLSMLFALAATSPNPGQLRAAFLHQVRLAKEKAPELDGLIQFWTEAVLDHFPSV